MKDGGGLLWSEPSAAGISHYVTWFRFESNIFSLHVFE